MLIHRLAASPSARTISPPHTGHFAGIRKGRRCSPSLTTRTTCGNHIPPPAPPTPYRRSAPLAAPLHPRYAAWPSRPSPRPHSPDEKTPSASRFPCAPHSPQCPRQPSPSCRAGNLKATAHRGALCSSTPTCCCCDSVHFSHHPVDLTKAARHPLLFPIPCRTQPSASMSLHLRQFGFTL